MVLVALMAMVGLEDRQDFVLFQMHASSPLLEQAMVLLDWAAMAPMAMRVRAVVMPKLPT